MSDLAYALALVLAVLFAWAGAAKLADRTATATSFAALGLPAPRALSAAVPVVELGLAATLVVVPRPGAAVALATLGAFTLVLVRAVRAGVDVGCACFGTARSEPVSTVEVARNLCMAGAALLVLVGAEPTAPSLAAVVLVTTGVATTGVVLALADLGRRTGHVLRVELGMGPDGGVDG